LMHHVDHQTGIGKWFGFPPIPNATGKLVQRRKS
jgi:hypothetical protein